MKRTLILAVTAVLAGAGALAAAGLLSGRVPEAAAPAKRVWTETAWPFPTDPWGKGKAFRCRAEHCGTDVSLYIRAKIGSCGCVTTIDDDNVDRIGDVDLVASQRVPLGPGQPIEVRWMKGRSRAYASAGRGSPAKSVLAIAFHERCDMIVATAAIGTDQPDKQEPAVIEFLNSEVVLRWAEVTLGL
jgi:hypothetical protein